MGEAISSSLIVEGRNIVVTEVVERAVRWPIQMRPPRTAGNALAAAQEALAALGVLRAKAPLAGEPPLEIVVALHYGTVIYGNVGAADRLDFTVIGPAVNLVSRIEAIAKSLDLPLIMSDDFVCAYGGALKTLGLHQLRGLDLPDELFTPLVV